MALRCLPTSADVGVWRALVAPLMSVNGPVAAAPCAHCQVAPLSPPSGSASSALSGIASSGCSTDSVTVPASSTLVTVMVTATLSSVLGVPSGVPDASSPSVTAMVMEYDALVS